MAATWSPFPVRCVPGVIPGTVTVVPNEYDLARAQNRVDCAKANLDEAEERLSRQSADKSEVDLAQMGYENLQGQLRLSLRLVERAKDAGEVRNYEILPHTFIEVMNCEDNARDWVQGEPRVNIGKMILLLLAEHVRLDGRIMSRAETDAMEPPVAQSIGGELYALTNPDLAALPFWKPRPTPSKTKG